MKPLRAFSTSLCLLPWTFHPTNAKDKFDPTSYASSDVITCDVAVIGGGSSGTYGAINLHKRGQSVVLVEKEAVLGGHTNTYTDPLTNITIDYGVQAYWNIPVTQNYLNYLGIETTEYTGYSRKEFYANFETGQEVTFTASSNYTAYVKQIEKYPYLEWSWNLPNPVPSDLLLPFAKFMQKYDLEDLGYNVFWAAQGLSNVLEQLTVNVFKIFDKSFIDALQGGDVRSVDGNGEIYNKASAILKGKVLYSSQVVASSRPADGTHVKLAVATPRGNKLIIASKLLVSIPPLFNNMKPFGLTTRESNIFSQWSYSGYYTILVNNTGLPSGYRFRNANAATLSNIPKLPGPYQITETNIPGLFYIWYGSPYALEEAAVKKDITAVIRRLQKAVGANGSPVPHFVEFKSHTPFKLVVSGDSIRDGFYRDLEELQGYRNTWYTGAAVISHSSAILWNFTETLLPQIIAAQS
ncbi:hypothetical protein N7509_012261 [Penicillium cosmopolitanum]|uniref:Amine oxidase domain-containing protein n=1 Tax=Penicillium cosmopolitanum TaxID=1131564 RepID=A0A9W9SJ54_9EURO|nr:uncharacterized protein N7509_012261 [Penicillium cosmopolitanum]KAJ5379142.1 hypothetical protein N7509_012261 [Penicillium cosmopolitanum]